MRQRRQPHTTCDSPRRSLRHTSQPKPINSFASALEKKQKLQKCVHLHTAATRAMPAACPGMKKWNSLQKQASRTKENGMRADLWVLISSVNWHTEGQHEWKSLLLVQQLWPKFEEPEVTYLPWSALGHWPGCQRQWPRRHSGVYLLGSS